MAKTESPEPRFSHESALIEDELHLFGGLKGKLPYHYFPRNEIWTCNVKEEKKWIRRFAKGKNIPPPCLGARCVVINGIIYSYGGWKEDGSLLGEVFGLDAKKMKWIQVATPIYGKKPWQRCYCCLWAIGGRIIMFGGESLRIPQDRLQLGAQFKDNVNNEIYEFVFDEGREKGYWLDVELSGKRPQPRAGAAMETIDQHRGILHGGATSILQSFDDAFVFDLREKKWICIDFLPKPSARSHHRICRLVKRGFKRKNCFLMIGGYLKETYESGYIIDLDKQKSHKIDLTPDVTSIWFHTLHCVANQDGSAYLIISGGKDRKDEDQRVMKISTLGPSNKSYAKIEFLLLAGATLAPSPGDRKSLPDVEDQLQRMTLEMSKTIQTNLMALLFRKQYETLTAEKSALAAQCRDLQEQVERQNAHSKTERRTLVAEKFEKETQCQALQAQCETLERETARLHAERQTLESQCQVLKSQLQTLQDSLDNRNALQIPYEKATTNPSIKIGDSYVPINTRICPVVSKALTPKGIDMTIAEKKCSLSIPPGAVDDPIVVSSCLLSDNGKSKSETRVALTDVVQLLPHGTKLKKAATLKLKHDFAFRKNHSIKVTLLYQSGTDSKKVFKTLCVLTALNQVVSFRFGYAILAADKIIVKATSFCYICGENNGCCIKLSQLVLAPTDLTPSQFRQGFVVKLCFCEASEEKEDKVIKKECERAPPHAFEIVEKREFSLCECGNLQDKNPTVLPIVATIKDSRSAAAWSIDGCYEVDFRELRAIFKGDYSHQPYYFEFSLSDSSLDIGNRLTVTFTLQWEKPMKLVATFKAKNPELSPPQKSASLKGSLGSPTETDLDRMVTEEELNKVAKYFPDDWKDLARELKVDVKKVEAAHQHEPQEHPHNMLKLWRRRNGTAATVRLLCQALLDVEHRLAAEMVFPDASKRLLRESTTPL